MHTNDGRTVWSLRVRRRKPLVAVRSVLNGAPDAGTVVRCSLASSGWSALKVHRVKSNVPLKTFAGSDSRMCMALQLG
jgi:hypothetical protein